MTFDAGSKDEPQEKDLDQIADEASPWMTAETAKPLPRTYFGHLMINCWYCTLQKGYGKVPFDPSQDSVDQRRTAIDISISPLPSSRAKFDTERSLIAESQTWAKIVLPSIKALDVSLRDLNEKYVQYEMVETGRTWTSKQGEEKHETMPVFKAVFDTLDEAEAAAAELYGGNGNGASDEDQEAPAGNNGADAQRQTAQAFLPALWMQSGHDVTKLAELIANNPLTSKFFTVSSPEVIAVVGGGDA